MWVDDEDDDDIEELSGDDASSAMVPVLEEDWKDAYVRDEEWAETWALLARDGVRWPPGYRRVDGRMYQWNCLCVLFAKVEKVIREMHSRNGHPCGDLVLAEMDNFFIFPRPEESKAFTECVMKQFDVCQESG